jgi:hypothetical protein
MFWRSWELLGWPAWRRRFVQRPKLQKPTILSVCENSRTKSTISKRYIPAAARSFSANSGKGPSPERLKQPKTLLVRDKAVEYLISKKKR